MDKERAKQPRISQYFSLLTMNTTGQSPLLLKNIKSVKIQHCLTYIVHTMQIVIYVDTL